MDDLARVYWTAEDDLGSSDEEGGRLLRIRMATAAGDLTNARRLINQLTPEQQARPLLVGIKAWIDLLDGPNGASSGKLEVLREAADSETSPSPYLQSLLTRALAITGQKLEAEQRLAAHELAWPGDPDVKLARSAVAEARGEFLEALTQLQSLRAQFSRRSFTALTHEMILAIWLRDNASFEDAYRERSRIEGRRPIAGVPVVWTHLRLVLTALLGLWALGVVFAQAVAQVVAILGLSGLALMNWHVLRKRRLALRFAFIPALCFLISIGVGIWYARP
jgi:hypothetical protein